MNSKIKLIFQGENVPKSKFAIQLRDFHYVSSQRAKIMDIGFKNQQLQRIDREIDGDFKFYNFACTYINILLV